MKVFAHKSINFGDYLARWIPEQLGHEVELVNADCNQEHYAITGSILNHTTENCIVWGAGIANVGDSLGKPKEILATRGKLSFDQAWIAGYKPQAFGDPALLLPDLIDPDDYKYYRLGILPHFADYYDVMQQYRDGFEHPGRKVIDLLLTPEDIVREISECDACISSSLHGLILAHAYGIPCRWVEFGSKVIGDGFKFRDYFSSVGISQEPLDLRESKPVEWIINQIPQETGTFDRQALWDCCPFKT